MEKHAQVLRHHESAISTILTRLGLTPELTALSSHAEPLPHIDLQPTQRTIHYQPVAKPYLPPSLNPNDTVSPPTLTGAGLIESGLIPLQQANQLFQQYRTYSTSRLATLLPVDHLPSESCLLRDVILTLGVRSTLSAETERLHQSCIAFTRHRIITAGAITQDDVNAAMMFSQWYSDHRMCRMVIGWAMELGMQHSASAFRAFRLEERSGDAAESRRRGRAVIKRLRIWMSCCSAELM